MSDQEKNPEKSYMQALTEMDAGEIALKQEAMDKEEEKRSKAASLPPGHKDLERIDIERVDLYGEAMIARHRARYAWAVQKIRDRFTVAKAGVDFGCGTGYGTKMLLEVVKGVVGVDNAPDAIRQAVRRCPSGCSVFYNGAEGTLPHPAVLEMGVSAYDVIVAIEVIEHLKDPGTFLSAARKLTRPNGMLLATTPVRPADKGPNWKPTNPFHRKEYSPEEFRALIEKAGWQINNMDLARTPGFIYAAAEAGK